MPAAAAVGVEQQEAVGEQIATTEQSTVNQIEEVAEEVAMAVEMAVAWSEAAVGDKIYEAIWSEDSKVKS